MTMCIQKSDLTLTVYTFLCCKRSCHGTSAGVLSQRPGQTPIITFPLPNLPLQIQPSTITRSLLPKCSLMQCGAAAILLTRSSCSEVQGNQIALQECETKVGSDPSKQEVILKCKTLSSVLTQCNQKGLMSIEHRQVPVS